MRTNLQNLASSWGFSGLKEVGRVIKKTMNWKSYTWIFSTFALFLDRPAKETKTGHSCNYAGFTSTCTFPMLITSSFWWNWWISTVNYLRLMRIFMFLNVSKILTCDSPCVSFQSLSHVWLFAPPWLQHARLSCPSPSFFGVSSRRSCRSSSVQFSSVAQSCPTLCDPMNRSTPGLPVHTKRLL